MSYHIFGTKVTVTNDPEVAAAILPESEYFSKVMAGPIAERRSRLGISWCHRLVHMF
jgi:hypothetical protein